MGRHHFFEEIVNFRDLGGYNAADGAVLKEGRVYRSSMLFGPTEHDRQKWESLGIDTIIDLRAPKELVREPNAYADLVGRYVNVNLSGRTDAGRSSELAQSASSPYFMSDRYLEYLSAGDELAKVFRIFLERWDRPLVFHCSAGKDRTGVISYLLLSLHGVPLAEIVADYQVSYTYMKQDPRLLDPDKHLNIYVSYPEIMELFHQAFVDKYGSVEDYLRSIGLDEEEVAGLQGLLL